MRVVGWVLTALVISACGPKTMEARMRDAERFSERGSGYLDEAEKAGAALEPKKMQSSLEDAREQLTKPDAELHPETAMHLDRLKELEAKLPLVKAEREKRDLEVRLNKAREKVVPRVQAMLEAQETLTQGPPTPQLIDKLEDTARAVKDAVESEQDLFAKDADFAAWAKSQRNKVDKASEAVSRARRAMSFLDGPAAAWRDALSLQQQAKEKKALGEKHAALEQMRSKLGACEKGAKPFDDDKATSSVAFAVAGGKPLTPGQLAAACTKTLKDSDGEFKKVATALDAERAKEAKEKAAREAKEARERAAQEAKDKKERAAQEAKDKKEKAAREAQEKKEKAAADAKAKKEKAAREAQEKKDKAAREAQDKKDKAAREAQEKKDKAAADAKAKKEKAEADAKAKKAAADAKAKK